MQREKVISLFRFIVLTLLFFIPSISNAGDLPDTNAAPIAIELIPENETIQPGRTFWMAVKLKMDKGWHAYWKNPGDSGMAIAIDWELPPGFVAGNTEWPYPKRFALGSLIGYGYEDEVWLLTPITPPQSLNRNIPVEIKGNVNWLVCSEETCLPGSSPLSRTLNIELHAPAPNNEHIVDFGKARAQIPQKHWDMHASRKDDLIELHLQAPNHEKRHYQSALFFPEHSSMIDPTAETVLLSPHPNHYVVMLKDSNKQDRKPAVLKGVVVLESSNELSSATNALEVHIPIAETSPANPVASFNLQEAELPQITDSFEPKTTHESPDFEGGLPVALLFAFLGGLLLNLMPCVLPVVSFKILSFVKLAGQSRKITLRHGLAFGAGVMVSFWILAGIMLILQAYGRSAGWGFQLQEPLFVAILAAVLTIFGLSLFGVFELGVSMTALAGSGQSSGKTEYGSSFFSGVLATAVATPCTGPFLGSAIGFAVTLPAYQSLLIFTFLGFGMALPYLLLAYFPQWLRFVPKPGEWMMTFKVIMGFLMLGTVLWLLWVFGAQTGALGIIILLWALFFLSFGCWIYGKWSPPVNTRLTRWISYAFAGLCFCIGSYIISYSVSPEIAAASSLQQAHEDKIWQPFSETKVANLRQKGIPVFVDFTAKWCLICQTNHLVLSTPEVEARFAELGVVRMKADWTKNDAKISAALRKFGRNGVPLYVLYSPDPSVPPQILPQVLTPDIVLSHLKNLNADVAERK